MSHYLTLLNHLKATCNETWLSPSQQIIWNTLHELLPLNEVINLYGDSGSGKTFLAWLLTKAGQVTYHHTYKTIPEQSPNMILPILDHQSSSRSHFRTLLKELNFRHLYKAIIITQTSIHDDCYRINLSLTSLDYSFIKQRLLLINPTFKSTTNDNLWQFINPDLVSHERGEL
jgi:hypothetical protein